LKNFSEKEIEIKVFLYFVRVVSLVLNNRFGHGITVLEVVNF